MKPLPVLILQLSIFLNCVAANAQIAVTALFTKLQLINGDGDMRQ